ncbi:lysophospholipase L1-like esterase [Cecembia rubra]|uniref:Lysophospholipase L1-like esterase n=2 Tax=Cecembia rubra TaxID=1485585 RepID=A0A2P8EEE0_9BACT|nr:lysophospholipase L1-like esterase [Cecembia rubra]
MNKLTYFILLLSSIYFNCTQPKRTDNRMKDQKLTYLALGDSYTIGEGVEEAGRYPNQTVELLKSFGLNFEKPTIIAKTGWTTDELNAGINNAGIEHKTFDLVTLLIGVNNQYRGRSIENYQEEFEDLLNQAIRFADGDASHVAVISIPDWGVTPFALDKGSNQQKVKQEIDLFNKVNGEISKKMGVHYIHITERYREVGFLPEMVVEDKLHPSHLIYEEWAIELAKIIEKKMQF